MNKYCQFLEQKLKYVIIAKCQQVQMVKTIQAYMYVGVSTISSFYKILEIRIILEKVRFSSVRPNLFEVRQMYWFGRTSKMEVRCTPTLKQYIYFSEMYVAFLYATAEKQFSFFMINNNFSTLRVSPKGSLKRLLRKSYMQHTSYIYVGLYCL